MCGISLESGKLFDVIQKFPKVREVPCFHVVFENLWPLHCESPRQLEAGIVHNVSERPFVSGCESERSVNRESPLGKLIGFDVVNVVFHVRRISEMSN